MVSYYTYLEKYTVLSVYECGSRISGAPDILCIHNNNNHKPMTKIYAIYHTEKHKYWNKIKKQWQDELTYQCYYLSYIIALLDKPTKDCVVLDYDSV